MGTLPERGRPSEDLNSPFLSDERGSIKKKKKRVVYSHFEKWYKRTYTDGVIPVEVVDPSSLPESKAELKPSTRIKHLEVMFSNGLLVKHNNLDYTSLKELINKLESIC